jgi:hypothetical protein
VIDSSLLDLSSDTNEDMTPLTRSKSGRKLNQIEGMSLKLERLSARHWEL